MIYPIYTVVYVVLESPVSEVDMFSRITRKVRRCGSPTDHVPRVRAARLQIEELILP
jgi:hypothetical protein